VRADERDDLGTDEPRPAGPEGPGSRPAGPVVGDAPSPSQATGEGPTPTPPAGEASEEDAQSLGRVEHDLDELLSQRDEYLDLAKRTKADFENYRKRMSAEILAAPGQGKAEVIRQVVPVLDDLERAIQAAGLDPEGDSDDGLAHGVLLVFRSFRDALAKNGVEAMDPTGERFDPNLHEALSTRAADGVESGSVVETMQKGYRLGEQLIRPARVVVAQ
jgi:molecular chaperone GrpE